MCAGTERRHLSYRFCWCTLIFTHLSHHSHLLSRSVRRVVVRSRLFVCSKSREAYATRVQECESIRPRSDDEQEKEDSYSECSYSTTDVEHRRSSLRLSSSYRRAYIGTGERYRTFGSHHGNNWKFGDIGHETRKERRRNEKNEEECNRKSSKS